MKVSYRQARLARFALLIFAVAVAGMVVLAARGQAVGPVLSSSITGTSGVTAQQGLVLDQSSYISNHGGSNDAILTMNDEGTSFTAAVEIYVGESYTMNLAVRNLSSAKANAIMEMNAPRGMDVADGGASVQMGAYTWLFSVNAGGVTNLNLTMSPKDDLKPGFYAISGRISQISG
ncbi:MAG: hypothetical protein HY681_04655 [Chloroflexi bacterium]|nr:hypothetical protein [Chloroflexota bacterium]